MSRPALAGSLRLNLALRLLAGPKSRLLSSTARAALLATTLGVAALGIAMALMTGYREDLVRKLVGGSASILVYAAEPGKADVDVPARLASLAAVRSVDPVAFIEGVVAAGEREAEVTLRGAASGTGPFAVAPQRLERRSDGAWGAVLGGELAQTLHVKIGDPLRLTVLAFGDAGPKFIFRTLRVTGTFESGFSEFDQGWVVVGRGALAGAPGAAAAVWELRLADPARAPAVAEQVRARLGPGFLVLDWRQLNRELFAALELQQRTLFLLLGLIVLVATFNVASTLVVLVRERRRDFGVLAALGLTPAGMSSTFVLVGALLGGIGTAAGLGIAAVVSTVATRFELLRFPPEMAQVYFLRAVPLRLSPLDAAAVGALAVGVTLAACWLPARRGAAGDPAAALRFE
jgi:lipoprotein-releasing system permease protein